MLNIKKAEASRAEVTPPLRNTAPTESEVASPCAVEMRLSNKTENDLGGVDHSRDVEASTCDRVRQIEHIDAEIRRAIEPSAIEYVPVGDLKPDPHNARKHPDRLAGGKHPPVLLCWRHHSRRSKCHHFRSWAPCGCRARRDGRRSVHPRHAFDSQSEDRLVPG